MIVTDADDFWVFLGVCDVDTIPRDETIQTVDGGDRNVQRIARGLLLARS